MTALRRVLLAMVVVGLLAPVAATTAAAEPAGTAEPRHAPAGIVSGLTIPWAAGGLRYNANGALENFPGEWPTVPVSAVRLWDTRTAWLNLEPARGQWNFASLDANVTTAHAHGVADITLVLWGTPTWAASSLDSGDAAWLGPGSAALPADAADWEEYVRTVVRRYSGSITAYEIGNEPNLRMFWRGTPAQLADLVSRAARIVHEEDPAALVVAPAPLLRSGADVPAFRPYLAALAAAAAPVDALAFHWYPDRLDVRDLSSAAREFRRAAHSAGLPAMPVWITEVGFTADAPAAPRQVSRLVPQTLAVSRAVGINRVYFYAWTDMPMGSLLPLHTGTALAQGMMAST